jgi:hypothetical protein
MLAKRWVVFLVLPALASMAFICGGSGGGQGIKIEPADPSAGGTPGLVPTLAAAPTAVGAPASADEVSALANNFTKVKSFKASIAQTGGANNLQGTIEYSAPDKVRVVVGSGATAQEIICLGEALYFKRGNTAWQKAPPGAATCRGQLGPTNPDELAKGINAAAQDKTLNKGGQETVDGRRCQIYAQALPNGASFEMCVADGLPVRLISKDPNQSVTIIFSDIDKPLDIRAPI